MVRNHKKSLGFVTNFEYPISETQIRTEHSISTSSGTPRTEGASFLPVAMDEDDAVGRNDDGKQSRRRLLFGSDLT